MTLLAYSYPTLAIVKAFGLDERTVANWLQGEGQPCAEVHQAFVEHGSVTLCHVQADEILSKGKTDSMDGASVGSPIRNRLLADKLLNEKA